MAHAPRTEEPPAPPPGDGVLSGLRDVPGISLRFGMHVTAWLLWHTSRVSLLADAPPPAELDRTAHV